MAYQMVATAVTLNDLEGHSPLADFFKCNPSNMQGCLQFHMNAAFFILLMIKLQINIITWFLLERHYVTFGSLLSQFRLSSVCLSVVCRL